MGIAQLIRARRAAVGGTYTLTLLENVCTLAYPALTGRAVDDLVERHFTGLVWLVAVWLVHLALSFVRQRVDTRVFMGLYADVASHIVAEQQAQGHGTSKVSARVEMVRDVVGFFEKEVPAMFHNVLAVVGFTLFGLGLAFYATPSTDAALSALPDDQAGSGSGIYKMASSLGASFGVAISATVFTALSKSGESVRWVEGVISFLGRQDNLAVRKAAFFALAINLLMVVAAIASIMVTIPARKPSGESL